VWGGRILLSDGAGRGKLRNAGGSMERILEKNGLETMAMIMKR